MDTTLMRAEGAALNKTLLQKAPLIADSATAGSPSCVAALNEVRATFFEWSDRWRRTPSTGPQWQEFSYTRLCLEGAVLPSIYHMIANLAGRSAKLLNLRAEVPYSDQLQVLHTTARRVEARGPSFIRSAQRPYIPGTAVFYLKMGMQGGFHLSQALRGLGEPLPTSLEMRVPDNEDAAPAAIPAAALALVLYGDIAELEKKVGLFESVPTRDTLIAISPVWWRRTLFSRVPCVLWMTSDRTLVLRRGQELDGQVVCALGEIKPSSVTWKGRVAHIRADALYKVDFEALPDEARAVNAQFLGMTESQWVDSVSAFASPTVALGGDLLKLIDMFKSRRDANKQVADWKGVLAR